jgi:hypothetical protein
MATKAKTTSKSTRTTTTKSTTTKKAAPRKRASKSAITEDEIARHAYKLWLERGGSDLDNWLEAERQLR